MANILLVWDRLGDYHRARWEALQRCAGDRQVYAADLGASDALYGWQRTNAANHLRLSEKPVGTADFWGRLGRFRRTLATCRVGYVCLAGYGRPEYLAMSWLARRRGCRVVLFAESWYGERGWLNAIKGKLLRQLCDGWLVSGSRAHDHFTRRLGVDPARVRTGYSVVDNHHFAAPPALPPPSRPVLLCVARFSPEKNLPALIRAFLRSDLATAWDLLLVGGGPQQAALAAMATDHRIQLRGWVAYQDLPGLYASAAAFVLPSTFEPWGLVVNEAMAAGLPVLVSHACGCAPDLVDARTGWRFHAHHPDEMTKCFNQLAALPPPARAAMGWLAREKVAGYTPGRWADAVCTLFNLDPADAADGARAVR